MSYLKEIDLKSAPKMRQNYNFYINYVLNIVS